jgi:integrase
VRSKKIIYRFHLEDRLGDKGLDESDVGEIARFRAELVQRGNLSEKRINNILAVLSKPLHYAADCQVIASVPKVIASVPKVGLFKVERPEIVAWDFAQYARILVAAKAGAPEWYAGACLAGEAGLRIGEVKALRWREDVDMIARPSS